ncbi:PREDICTED: peroxisomal membrane protein 11A-like, partial [Priapulus caudatus]|uniref:Peroxisomal membrane protein 11A-like n=1 Tax=Priapulus caudatus TaxID=37621 RepID=A0ABM1DQA7_PRICU
HLRPIYISPTTAITITIDNLTAIARACVRIRLRQRRRLVQYASRFIIWYMKDAKDSQTLIWRVKKLEAAMTSSRKLFRMFNSVEFLTKAIDSLAEKDDYLRYLSVIGMTGKGIWLLFDHLLWFGKIDMFKVNPRYSRVSAWAWLAANIALTLRDLRKLHLLRMRTVTLKQAPQEEIKEDYCNLRPLVVAVQLELAKDFCDIFIPLATLGYADTGLAAAGGVISSVIAMQQEWGKIVKN